MSHPAPLDPAVPAPLDCRTLPASRRRGRPRPRRPRGAAATSGRRPPS